jgi:hypothetical protein
MPNSRDFMHIPLPLKCTGRPKLHGGGSADDRTAANKDNRNTHGATIKNRAGELSRFWKERRDERTRIGLPDISVGIPFLLEIDPKADVEFLRGLGFEIVCSLSDGFIVVASIDVDLEMLNKKTDDFINEIGQKCNSPAKIYALCSEIERLSRILSDEFRQIWDTLQQCNKYTVDISVSCGGTTPLPSKPVQKDNEDDSIFAVRITRWQEKFNADYQKWDELASARQEEITRFISAYEGEIPSGFIDETDSFSFRLVINGKGLRDFVLNYPYIFEVSQAADVKMEDSSADTAATDEELEILAPNDNAPIVCVIDSGIQEAHQYIAPAILSEDSVCLIPGDTSVNDEVLGGGHGTRVAGTVLYPNGVPRTGSYQLPAFIRNIKVLDRTNGMPDTVDPAKVVVDSTTAFAGDATAAPSKIYNHSIGERKPFTNIAHMSPWAAQIDKQSYEKDILFIQAAGNISDDIISTFIKAGHAYPNYLGHDLSRLSNPAQSLQALTVGSVSDNDFEDDDTTTMGKNGEIASFSRIGPGIWDTIKPDVVEYGGTHAKNKVGADVRLTTPPEVCPELIRRSPPGKAFDRDSVGTSFSTPKVSYIAAEIAKIFPQSPALLYRALITQSARWFNIATERTEEECENILRRIGFGLPNIERATRNNEYRITLITPELVEIGEKEAHVYSIKIPDELNAVGEDFDVLVEVTLSYAANPRRTRRYIKSYLSTWVDWICSRANEDPETFVTRIFETGGSVDDSGNFNWMLGESRGRGRGQVSDFSRSKGTLQKDWCIIKSNQLTDEFCIGVRGHQGWGDFFKAKYSLAVSFEAINQDIAIYEPIHVLNEVEIETAEITVEVAEATDA